MHQFKSQMSISTLCNYYNDVIHDVASGKRTVEATVLDPCSTIIKVGVAYKRFRKVRLNTRRGHRWSDWAGRMGKEDIVSITMPVMLFRWAFAASDIAARNTSRAKRNAIGRGDEAPRSSGPRIVDLDVAISGDTRESRRDSSVMTVPGVMRGGMLTDARKRSRSSIPDSSPIAKEIRFSLRGLRKTSRTLVVNFRTVYEVNVSVSEQKYVFLLILSFF